MSIHPHDARGRHNTVRQIVGVQLAKPSAVYCSLPSHRSRRVIDSLLLWRARPIIKVGVLTYLFVHFATGIEYLTLFCLFTKFVVCLYLANKSVVIVYKLYQVAAYKTVNNVRIFPLAQIIFSR